MIMIIIIERIGIMENSMAKYKVFNPERQNCPICEVYNGIDSLKSFQKEVKIPEAFGEGYCRKILVKSSMEISISDVTFCERITLGGGHNNQFYCFAFCLGDPLRWREEGNKQEYEISCGENYIFDKRYKKGICTYQPGQRFLGIRIDLEEKLLVGLMNYLGKEDGHGKLSRESTVLLKKKFSSTIKRILNEMIHCPYEDTVKRIYLEGKILELLAVYMNEVFYQNENVYASVGLSSSDVKALYNARKILEESIVNPPTIAELSRLVCLNEYKLKKGFKELFEMPVHAYIIDKRLEMARYLLEEKKARVTEAVLMVGYSDASHFAEKFRKKYGVNPSEYSKNR